MNLNQRLAIVHDFINNDQYIYIMSNKTAQLFKQLENVNKNALNLYQNKNPDQKIDTRKTNAQPNNKRKKGQKKRENIVVIQQQIKQAQEQEQPLALQAVQKLTYQPGAFSKFAYKQQTQVIRTKQYVSKIISQAIQSHVKRLQYIAKVDRQLEQKAVMWQTLFKNQFQVPQLLIQFIKNPLQAQLTEIQSSSFNIQERSVAQYIRKFVKRVIQLRQFAVVENRIVDIRDFNLSQYIRDQYDNIYLPSNIHQRFYLQISQSKVSHAYFQKDNMFSRQQMLQLTKKQRETIVEMVFRFLKQKGIVIEKMDIFDEIAEIVKNK